MSNYFEFEVSYWSAENNCEKFYYGLTCAQDYTEAAKIIDEWYESEDKDLVRHEAPVVLVQRVFMHILRHVQGKIRDDEPFRLYAHECIDPFLLYRIVYRTLQKM